ncbi:MAG: hypothetical protein ACTSSH_09775 [Candidatus Heimdallarchaeota archaeon]
MHFVNLVNFANIIAGLVAIIVSILILVKDIRASTNILFFVSLFTWGISLVFNGFTFIFEHPTTGAKIFRDIVSAGGSVASFFIFASAFIMFKGEHYIRKWYFIVPMIVGMIVNTSIVIFFDHVVYDSPDGITDIGEGIKTTQEPWVKIFLYGVPILLISAAIFYFALTRRTVDEKIIKKRILYFILGFSSIILGTVIYAIAGLFEQLSEFASGAFEYLVFILAGLCWTAAPILMFLGFNIGRLGKRKKKPDIEESISS